MGETLIMLALILALYGIPIYLTIKVLRLAIKALKIYIAKNSNEEP